jgi:hypothetical protein
VSGEAIQQAVKCFVIVPTTSIKEVRDFLDSHGISYSYDEGVIFGNLSEIPPGLKDIATVDDPVFSTKEGDEEKWYFCCCGEVMGPYANEHRARVNFVQYISWSGEFVNNAAHPRNDA